MIAYNGLSGVRIISEFELGYGNLIQGNSIYGNTDGVTPNDPGDSDTGANNLQNFPVLTDAYQLETTVSISGTLNSTPNTQFRIEFFAIPTCDSSGYGEGKTYLGYNTHTTDHLGTANVSLDTDADIPFGNFVTATATDP